MAPTLGLGKVKGWNLNAAVQMMTSMIRKPQLLVPHLAVQDLNAIDFEKLKRMGFHSVVFDKDNTITYPHRYEVADEIKTALESCKQVFEPENIVLFSNSAGSNDDVGFHDAVRVEQHTGLSVLRHNTKKPNGSATLLAHFGLTSLDQVIMIGDRYSTDVLFGNMNGMLTVRTQQLTIRDEHPVNRSMQRMESQLVAWIRAAGVAAPQHQRYHQL